MQQDSGFLVRRLLTFETRAIPHAASARLHKFVNASMKDPKDQLAVALRAWIVAQLSLAVATEESKMAMEQISCTKAMAVAAECLCDLIGLDGCESDLRGALLLASLSSNDELRASLDNADDDTTAVDKGAPSPAKSAPAEAEEDEDEGEEEGDAEEHIIALQEQKDTLHER